MRDGNSIERDANHARGQGAVCSGRVFHDQTPVPPFERCRRRVTGDPCSFVSDGTKVPMRSAVHIRGRRV